VTELIRSWPDSGFYISSAGTQNALEQFTKLQTIAKLLRALSDATQVDSNGDKLQDILVGQSLGNLSQRHKWRTLYDTVNNRYLIQYNTGTDAAKTWSEVFRLDTSGNLTVTGTISTDSITTTAGGLTLTGDLDVNDFYIRNAEDIFTNDLRVGGNLTLKNNHTPGWVYIAQKTASSAAVIDLTGLTHYPRYMVTLDGVVPNTDGVSLLMRTSTNNGATYDETAAYDAVGRVDTFPASTTVVSLASTSWNLNGSGTQDNATASALSGTVTINALGSASLNARMRSEIEWLESTGVLLVSTNIAGRKTSNAEINAIRFLYSSGAIASGTFRLYGLRES